jgi:hypothetical protein
MNDDTDDPPVPLDRRALDMLIEPDDVVDLTMPAFGSANPPTDSPLVQREQNAYQWTRENYLDFIDRIRNADIEGPVAVGQLREYVMRQLVALSGHPDPKVAIKALEMLGKVKNVGLFDEKRSREGVSSSDTAAVRAAILEASRMLKGVQ